MPTKSLKHIVDPMSYRMIQLNAFMTYTDQKEMLSLLCDEQWGASATVS
jgi:hypothetical protein